jgi:uncharacterized protein (UPF0262 family)
MADTNRLSDIQLDDSNLPAPTPEVEQERKIALFDLMEANSFALHDITGPYRLGLAIRDRRLEFDVRSENSAPLASFHLSLSPFRQIIKDYFLICDSYFDAVKRLPASQIEAIDMGRREIHNEGARILKERLQDHVAIDDATSRRLFSLLCVLHTKG